MLDAGISILDRLIQLLSTKEINDEKYFNNFIEPMYQDAETIVKDYISLFTELIERLKKDEDVIEVITWIEKRRMDFLPIRMKVRALLTEKNYNVEIASTFQKGIMGLMKGGLSFIEKGHAQVREYGMGDHTVLDLLYHCTDMPVSYNREKFIHNANRQLKCIQLAWEDVVKGYAELKQMKLSPK